MTAPDVTPYDAEFYAEQSEGSLRSARVMVPLLLTYIHPRSVLDVGCGIGAWLKVFQENGVDDITGHDGDYVDPAALLIDPAHFRAADLRAWRAAGRTYGLAISLEVAEHLPPAAARSFVGQLTAAAPAVLFGAAIPGQGGTNHLNEQWQEYWRALFLERGFHPVDLLRPRIWGRPEVEFWYQQNTILYCGDTYLAEHPDLAPVARDISLDLVHPRLYDQARAMTPALAFGLAGYLRAIRNM